MTAGLSIIISAACGDEMTDASPHEIQDKPLLFYIHGAIIETQGITAVHPRHGAYEYEKILARFRAEGFEVRSRVRNQPIGVAKAAVPIAAEISAAIAKGTNPAAITVVGFSKGGAIALRVADTVPDEEVGYVIIAGCGDWIPDQWIPKGQLLTIREASDNPRIGDCSEVFERTRQPSRHRSILLHLGHGHGAFYRPRDAWIEPIVSFARQRARRP